MSNNTTRYEVTVDGTPIGFNRATKATVIAHADALRASRERGHIVVATTKGTVVYELKAVKSRVVTRHTRPFTLELHNLPAEIAARVPEGYVAAYARLTNGEGAIVLRNEDAEDDARYCVMNATTGAKVGFAPTTRAAGQIMKGMRRAS